MTWCRTYSGREVRDICDVPYPVVLHWHELLVPYREYENLGRNMYNGMVDSAKVQEARRKLCIEAGFIIGTTDEMYREYYKSYERRKADAGDRMIAYGGGQAISEKDSLLLQLKRKIKEQLAKYKREPDGD